MMIFEKNPLSFSSKIMVYVPYNYVPISYGAGTFFDSGRLLYGHFHLNSILFGVSPNWDGQKNYKISNCSQIIFDCIHCSHPNSTSSLPFWPFCYMHVIYVPTKFSVIFIIDFEIFIHLLNEKLWGLPRRVFTLL